MPQARRFHELGVVGGADKEMPELEQVDGRGARTPGARVRRRRRGGWRGSRASSSSRARAGRRRPRSPRRRRHLTGLALPRPHNPGIAVFLSGGCHIGVVPPVSRYVPNDKTTQEATMEARLDLHTNPVVGKLVKHIDGRRRGHYVIAAPRPTQELVKLRASQIHGCAVCTDMHTKEGRTPVRPPGQPGAPRWEATRHSPGGACCAGATGQALASPRPGAHRRRRRCRRAVDGANSPHWWPHGPDRSAGR